MMHRLSIAALMLACIVGCAQESEPLDPTRAALQLVRSGKYDDAIMTATEAIRAKPDNAEAYLYRGRAYHYRNAMGDRPRAVEDFSAAIRLAPESSDPYYFRAQVYRDLGEIDLAATDETKARQLDSTIQETYDRMPDLPTSTTDADLAADQTDGEPKTAGTGGSMPRTEDGQRQLYEELKNRFEPGFGELRPSASRSANLGTGAKSREQRRQLTGQSGRATERERASDPVTSPYDPFAARKPAPDAATTLPGTTTDTAVTPSAGPATDVPSLRRNVQAPIVPPLSSPFAQRPAVPPMTDPTTLNQNVQSPFPQRTPGATGFGVPTNPFGAQTQGSTPRSVSRPFSVPAPTNQNPAVRPLVPRPFP